MSSFLTGRGCTLTFLLGILGCLLLVGCSQTSPPAEYNPPETRPLQPSPSASQNELEIGPTLIEPLPPISAPGETEPGNLKALPEVLLISPETVRQYLEANVGVAGFGGKVFCAHETLATQDGLGGQASMYLWVLCQEYYKAGQELTKGTGISLPVALFLRDKAGVLQIASHTVPGDGDGYGKVIHEVFPAETWPLIFPLDQTGQTAYNQRAQRLEAAAERLARAYFSANP